jgi:hypothetical protein
MTGDDSYAYWFDRLGELAEARHQIAVLVEYAELWAERFGENEDRTLTPAERQVLTGALAMLESYDARVRETARGAMDEEQEGGTE